MGTRLARGPKRSVASRAGGHREDGSHMGDDQVGKSFHAGGSGSGSLRDVFQLLTQFRQEFERRMDELAEKVDKKFDSLPDQYPSRREFNILAGQVAKLEERVFDSTDGRFRDLLDLNQRVEQGEITRLRDESQASRSQHQTSQAVTARWEVALVGWAIAFIILLINILVAFIPHLTVH